MTSSIHDQIINIANQTQVIKAQTKTEASSSVNSNDFLYLLTQQLQYQDPTNPMDNSEMLAQEAQFSTLEQLESLTSSFSQFANVFQANSLIGQNVEITTDNKTITGKVDYVDYSDSNGAAVSVNGNLYPIANVQKVMGTDSSSSNNSVLESAVNAISNNLSTITSKVNEYIK